MHTEHSFRKSYFFHFNKCMYCNKISVLKPVYKCTGCSKVSHQSCLDRNQCTTNDRLGLDKRIVKDQKKLLKIKYNELGELSEPNYLNNMLVVEKQHPISLMSEKYLKSRHTEHKSLFFSIQTRVLEPYTTVSLLRRTEQESSALSAAVTEPVQGINVFLSTQEISALVSTPEINLEEQEQSLEALEPVSESSESDARVPEINSQALESGARIPESSARPPELITEVSEPNSVATDPDAAKPEFSKPVSEQV